MARNKVRPGWLTRARGVLTASGGDTSNEGMISTLGLGTWQKRGWNYYDIVPELHYVGNFVGNALARLKVSPGIQTTHSGIIPARDADGNPAPDEGVSEADIAAAEMHLTDVIRPRRLHRIGIGYAIVGECHLIFTDGEWSIRSTDEVEMRSDGKIWLKSQSGAGSESKELGPSDFHLRLHVPHPRWYKQADSGVRAALDVLEEIVLRQRALRAHVLSRLSSAGIYWISSEIGFLPENEDDDDPLASMIIDAAAEPINEPNSAGGVIPIIARAPFMFIKDGIRLDRFDSGPDEKALVLNLKAAIARLAAGVDLPMEVILGTHETTSHWTAWQIDEAIYRAHIEPLAERLFETLTHGFLKKVLIDGGTSPEVAERFRIIVDPTELIQHPNRETAVQHGYGDVWRPNFGVSGRAWRKYNGIPESDAPDEIEIAARIWHAQQLHLRVSKSDDGMSDELESPVGPDNVTKGPPAGTGPS